MERSSEEVEPQPLKEGRRLKTLNVRRKSQRHERGGFGSFLIWNFPEEYLTNPHNVYLEGPENLSSKSEVEIEISASSTQHQRVILIAFLEQSSTFLNYFSHLNVTHPHSQIPYHEGPYHNSYSFEDRTRRLYLGCVSIRRMTTEKEDFTSHCCSNKPTAQKVPS